MKVCSHTPRTELRFIYPGRLLNTKIARPAVNLNHFRLLRVVGKGAFGKVRIVERKDTGLTFALKYIRKDEGKRIHINSQQLDCQWADLSPKLCARKAFGT